MLARLMSEPRGAVAITSTHSCLDHPSELHPILSMPSFSRAAFVKGPSLRRLASPDSRLAHPSNHTQKARSSVLVCPQECCIPVLQTRHRAAGLIKKRFLPFPSCASSETFELHSKRSQPALTVQQSDKVTDHRSGPMGIARASCYLCYPYEKRGVDLGMGWLANVIWIPCLCSTQTPSP